MRVILAACLLAGLPIEAGAQSMTPMRAIVQSGSDEFALRVYPRNVYDHPIQFEVRVYDEADQPVESMVFPQSFRAGPGQSKPVTVLVPFAGQAERRIRICAESAPLLQQQNQLKARICGRYLARHLR